MLIHSRPQRQFFTNYFFYFLRRSQIADGRQRAESKTLQVGPCACACYILSLRWRVAFFCHSICHVLLSSSSLVLNTCSISRHTCPFSLPGGPNNKYAGDRIVTLFSKSYQYISYGVKVLCVLSSGPWCCVYFLKNRSVVGTSISSIPRKC